MRGTQQFSIISPSDRTQMVKGKVASGEYADASDVIRDGLRALQARDTALETWLQTEAATAYDKLKADPARAVGLDQVRQQLADRRWKPA